MPPPPPKKQYFNKNALNMKKCKIQKQKTDTLINEMCSHICHL